MPSPLDRTAWPAVGFGDVVRLSNNRSKDPEADGIERYVGLEHLEPGDLKVRSWGDVADGTTFRTVFEPGQVLFGKRRAYQRKVAVADFSGVCSGDIYVLEPKTQDLLPELLPFICQTDAFFDHAIGTSAGSLSPRTNWKSLATFEFALPPLDEQRRIVEALTATNDLEERTIEILNSASDLCRSVNREVFGGGTSESAIRPIGEVLRIVAGGTPSRSNPDFWGGDIPWVKTGEVDNRVIVDTEESITNAGLQGSAAKLCPADSILVAMYGQGPTRGRVGLLGVAAATNQACAIILPDPAFDPWFVYYYLEGKYEELRSLAHGAAQPNLNLAMIKGFPIPCIPLPEQRQRAAVARTTANARTEASERLNTLRILRARLVRESFRSSQ